MMMPANYSVIAENEMTYVVGGGVIEAIGAVTAPRWEWANVKQLSTNIVTIVGNAKLQNVVNKTLGYVFGGNCEWKQLGENLKGLFYSKNGVGDTIATTLGTIAAVYNLGNVPVANKAGDTVLFKPESKPSKKYYGTIAGQAFEIWG